MNSGIIKRKSLIHEIVDRLIALIQSGAFQPGERLPSERKLCETFQVSRSSLRTALQQLEYNGIIEIRQGSGTYVSENAEVLIDLHQETASDILAADDHDEDIFMDRMECRILIEPIAARLAAIYATETEIQELDEIIARMEMYIESTHKNGFYAEDQNFHDCIARASRNQMIRSIINTYCVNVYYHLKSFGRIPDLAENSLIQHKKIVETIKAGDAQGAEKAMAEHVMYSFRENAKYIYHVKAEFRDGIL